MDTLVIEPGIGIGDIKLGMSKYEFEECIEAYTVKYQNKAHDPDYFNYVFRVEYDTSGKIIFIEIPSGMITTEFNCVFSGINVFNIKAEELVETIDRIAEYDRDQSELGYTYFFPELGLSLWRSRVFKAGDEEEEWFKELCAENQEDELRFLYFESVSITAETRV